MTKAELNDPLWRLCNLYMIVNKEGDAIQFKPTAPQRDFIANFGNRNLILKARQLGFSTLIQLMILDQCIFLPNIHAGVIAQNDESAAKIFQDKIKFAWDHMPDWVRQCRKTVGDSERQLRFDNGSYIRVATSMRSSALQFLHVSEFGKICADTPKKAREVMTGSIPTIGPNGFIFIESTAEGREGKFYEMVQAAQAAKKSGKKPGRRDYRLHFYAWFDCSDYTQDEPVELSDDDEEYFRGIANATGVELSMGQRWWYVSTRKQIFSGDSHMMRQEYPSMPDEAFEKPTEGCWFTTQMADMRKNGGVTRVPYQRGFPVHTAWDIGKGDGTAIWCFQKVGIHFRFIDFIEDWGKEYDYYVEALQSRKYVLGTHFLPHDAAHERQAKTSKDAKTAKVILEELGLTDIKIVKQVHRKILAINAARAIIPQCYFDVSACAKGLDHLDSYAKIWNTERAEWTSEPKHDIHSEAADAFMQFATGWEDPTVVDIDALLDRRNSYTSTNPFNR